jgi:CheY-like chemotaxis protein
MKSSTQLSPRRSSTRPRALTALLVTGHPEEAAMYGVKLRSDGYAVVPATGLEQALERATSIRPDLIFVCVGPWAVPALVLLVLRSDSSTRGVPTILVSDRTRAQISAEVGGLLTTENVVPRTASVHAAREERALSGRSSGCGRVTGWERWLSPGRRAN